MFRRILVAHDGSDGAFHALTEALAMAKVTRARLFMLCVEELPDYPLTANEAVVEDNMVHDALAKVIERAERLADRSGVRLTAEIRVGHPVEVLLDAVKQMRADLLVAGYHGHSALFKRVIGGVSDRLARLAPCSVLIVK